VQISEAQVGRAVRTHRWKYCVDAPDKKGGQDPGSESYVEQYLYDLQADPYELRNLIALESHQKVAEVMRERLIRRMVEVGEAVPEIVVTAPQRSGQRRVTEEEARG
jgi:arylsulfatase A-like enzyme